MTKLDKQWVEKNGIILLRFQKPDGGWHRTSIQPGQDGDFIMAQVNAHLLQMGHTEVGADDLSAIKNTIQVEHTPLKIAEFQVPQVALAAKE